MLTLLPLLFSCTPSSPEDSATGDTATTLPSICDVPPEGLIDMSVDEGPHSEPVEWWYWTGHLEDEAGNWYGFEQVFFQIEYGSMMAKIAQSAVTDIAGETFQYDYGYAAGEKFPEAEGFELELSKFTASGANGSDVIHGETEAYAFDLNLEATKQPVFHHGNGYTDYPYGGYTYYYSRPRMEITGTLSVEGEDRAVTGSGWFDHQWGDLTPAVDVGWDWFALQLDDGREVMIFRTRSSESGEIVGGSLTDAGCHTSELEEVTITHTDRWVSEVTGCDYPSGWELEVDGMNLTLEPVMLDQEVAVQPEIYWEGAVIVSGDATGRGYVELTNYCEE